MTYKNDITHSFDVNTIVCYKTLIPWLNRAEKSSEWLSTVGRSLEDGGGGGGAHAYRPIQSCEENHVFGNSYCNPRASTRGAFF